MSTSNISGNKREFLEYILTFWSSITWIYGSYILVRSVIYYKGIDVTVGFICFLSMSVGVFLSSLVKDSRILNAIPFLQASLQFLLCYNNMFEKPFYLMILSATTGAFAPHYLAPLLLETSIENRGRRTAIVVFLSILTILFGYFMTATYGARVFLLACFRLITYPFVKKTSEILEGRPKEREIEYRSRESVLYLSSILIFFFVDILVFQVYLMKYPATLLDLLFWFKYIPASMVIPLIGYVIDSLGRKGAILLTMLGLAFSNIVLTIFPTSIETLITYSLLDGVVWGSLTLIYYFVIWGDLLDGKKFLERYSYVLSILYVTEGASYYIATYLATLPPHQLYLFSSLLIIISIILLWFAQETLPYEIRERRRLYRYIKEARRLKN